MGVSLTSPTYTVNSPPTSEIVPPAECWSIPDSGNMSSYHCNTDVVVSSLSVWNHDATTATNEDGFTGSGDNGVTWDASLGHNGSDAFTASGQQSGGAHTLSLYHTLIGVPYCRVGQPAGGALHPVSDSGSSFRTWPRGVYAFNGSAWRVQH